MDATDPSEAIGSFSVVDASDLVAATAVVSVVADSGLVPSSSYTSSEMHFSLSSFCDEVHICEDTLTTLTSSPSSAW